MVIPGVEISAFNPETGRKAHILGYRVRDMETLTQACLPWLRARHDKNMESFDLIIKAGYPLCREEVLEYAAQDGTIYRQHIMHALADRGYSSAIYGPLYTRFFGPGAFAAVTARYMDAEEAVRLIRDCGAWPFLGLYSERPVPPGAMDAGLPKQIGGVGGGSCGGRRIRWRL